MAPLPRRIITAAVALLAVALLVASYLAGWWSDPTTGNAGAGARPQVEVPLPADAWDAAAPYPTSTVTLTVGQQLGVRTSGGALSHYWYLSSAGDGNVLRPGPDFVVTPCSTNPPAPGCAPEFDLTFSALAPGTTTLTWLFGQGGCKAGVPRYPAERCDISKSVQVTVR